MEVYVFPVFFHKSKCDRLNLSAWTWRTVVLKHNYSTPLCSTHLIRKPYTYRYMQTLSYLCMSLKYLKSVFNDLIIFQIKLWVKLKERENFQLLHKLHNLLYKRVQDKWEPSTYVLNSLKSK